MSLSRYSAGHTVLYAGVFALPYIPLLLLSWGHSEAEMHHYEASGWAALLALWIIGLAIYFALLVVHEFGHAIAGWLVGIKIAEITIGHWHRVARFRLGGTTITLRAAPDSGYVMAMPSPVLTSRWRASAFFLAGLLAEAGVLLVVWLVPYEVPHPFMSFGEVATAYARLCVFCFVTLHLLRNAWPADGHVSGGTLSNDGKQFWQLFRRSDAELAANAAALRDAKHVDELIAAGDYVGALALVQDLSGRLPENWGFKKSIGSLQLKIGERDAALATWEALLKTPGLTAEQTAGLLDGIASDILYERHADLYARAEAWVDEALGHAPKAITLKGTRGSLLVELGRLDEGESVLREVVRVSDDVVDQAISLAYLAKIAALRGNRIEAVKWLEKARRFACNLPFVPRLLNEVNQLIEQGTVSGGRQYPTIET